jgi:hypothetical protein
MSLAQPLALQPSPGYGPTALNPFGPNATLGSDQILQRVSPRRSPISPLVSTENPLAPQTFAVSTLVPPRFSNATENRINFTVGFGLDIPEEEEEPLPEDKDHLARDAELNSQERNAEGSEGEEQESDADELEELDRSTTAPQSRFHSRHVSRLSTALSLQSVGGLTEEFKEGDMVPLRSAVPNPDIDDLDKDAVGEWTGSEDLYMGSREASDDEVCAAWILQFSLTKIVRFRASENGRILQTRKGPVNNVSNVATVVVPKMPKYPEDYQISRAHPTVP